MFSSLSAPSSLTSSPSFSIVAVKAPPAIRSLVLRRRSLSLQVRACSNHGDSSSSFAQKLESLAKSVIFIGAAVSVAGKFSTLPAKAESPVMTAEEETLQEAKEEENVKHTSGDKDKDKLSSPLPEFLETNSEAIEKLRSLLQRKLENGEDEEALRILELLAGAQPEETEWKFLMARLLNEMGRTERAREVFEEMLEREPLSFEALFENALLMDRCGEGEAVMKRLEGALSRAEEEKKGKEARDVRLIMAQIQFLQKDVEGALKSYEELTREDPKDFRPYFCRGMIYSLLDRNAEAKEQFSKFRELSPKKFEVEGYLRTPLSRMKLFGTNEDEK